MRPKVSQGTYLVTCDPLPYPYNLLASVQMQGMSNKSSLLALGGKAVTLKALSQCVPSKGLRPLVTGPCRYMEKGFLHLECQLGFWEVTGFTVMF